LDNAILLDLQSDKSGMSSGSANPKATGEPHLLKSPTNFEYNFRYEIQFVHFMADLQSRDQSYDNILKLVKKCPDAQAIKLTGSWSILYVMVSFAIELQVLDYRSDVCSFFESHYELLDEPIDALDYQLARLALLILQSVSSNRQLFLPNVPQLMSRALKSGIGFKIIQQYWKYTNSILQTWRIYPEYDGGTKSTIKIIQNFQDILANQQRSLSAHAESKENGNVQVLETRYANQLKSHAQLQAAFANEQEVTQKLQKENDQMLAKYENLIQARKYIARDKKLDRSSSST
jgi:hypothetical protein